MVLKIVFLGSLVATIGVLIQLEGEAMGTNRVANVSRDPSSLRFIANWSDEVDNFDEATFTSLEEAIEWARARAPVVLVVLGFSRSEVFSAGTQYDPGEDPVDDPLPQWPPPEAVLRRLLADVDVPRITWSRDDAAPSFGEDE